MVKKLLLMSFAVLLVLLMTACTAQKNVQTAQENVQEEVNDSIDPSITLYSVNETIQIDASELEEYIKNGWYTEPVVTMYTPDGRTRVTLTSEVEAYKGVGWYTEPVVTMYAPDGRTRVTLTSEVEAYKGVGWYTEPVVTMYAPDGRTRVTLTSEVEAYKGVGWYTEPVNLIISFLPELSGSSTDAEILNYVNEHYRSLLYASFFIKKGVFLEYDYENYISHHDATKNGCPGLYKVTEKGFKNVEDIKTYISKNFSKAYVEDIDFSSYYSINGQLYTNVAIFGMEGITTYSFDSVVRNSDNKITVLGNYTEDDGWDFTQSYTGKSTCKFVLENGLWKCYYAQDSY